MAEPRFDWESGIDALAPHLAGAKRIGLQVPEGLRPRAPDIVARLAQLSGAEVLLWGEPTFGACDLADRPLSEVGVDALVHLGHLPMPYHADCYAVPVHFVPVQHTGALKLPRKAIARLRELLPERIGVVTTAQHLQLLGELQERLAAAGFAPEVGEGGPRLAAPGQLLGCNSAAARTLDVPGYLYLGTGIFHPLTVALSTGKPVACLDPHSGAVTATNADLFLRQRYAAIAAGGRAQRWAVMFSTQIGQERLALAERLAGELRDAGHEALLIGSIHQSEGQLAGLGIGAAVITACPRVAIEDGPTWSIPLLTVPELQILLGRRDSEPYPFDEFP